MVKESKLSRSFIEASRAFELDDDLAREVAALGTLYCEKLPRNSLRQRYYKDEIRVKNIGREIPKGVLANVDTSTEWAALAVDMLASRSIVDGFTVNGEKEQQDAANELMRECGLIDEYEMAKAPELVGGCGFWTVSRGDTYEPRVVANFHDNMTAVATYDYRARTIKSALIVNDLIDLPHGQQVATSVTLHTRDKVVTMERVNGRWRVVDKRDNPLNTPLVVQMAYRPTVRAPFGKSAISRSVMGITDSMKREIIRMEIHSEHHASPEKYLLDVSEEMYDKMEEDGAGLYASKMLVLEESKSGVTPKVGMLQPTGVDDRLKIQDKLARRFSSVSHIPMFALGIETAILTSSEALTAALAPLVTEAESLNRSNGRALNRVAQLAIALDGRLESLEKLTPAQRSVRAHFKDPACPNISQGADAMLKLASAPGADWLTRSDVFWERAGMTEGERIRLASDRRRSEAIAARDAILAVNG